MAIGLGLFLLLLPFHLVIKVLLPGPLGTYWKEGLLALLVLGWAALSLRERRLLLTGTALDGAVLAYAGLLLLRFLLDGAGWVQAWGLYISVLYLPLFWLVAVLLRRQPGCTIPLIGALTAVGALAALGGLAEFALDRPLWPSAEMVERQGFADVFIYSTHIRRVYFTFDSPTTLANTLALLLPLALALVLLARRPAGRWAAAAAAALMAGCIVVTFSRGIWVALALALAVMALVGSARLRPAARGEAEPATACRRAWPAWWVAGGALALIALAWGTVTLAGRGEDKAAYRGVLELSPDAYEAAPLAQVHRALLAQAPDYGPGITQTWSLLDPIRGRPDVRRVLYQHPPQEEGGRGETVYAVDVPAGGALRFAIALAPDTWSPDKGDGASFQLFVAEPEAPQAGQFVFVRYINPKQNPSDRRWRNYLVDLSPWAGRTVHLSLITESGPAGDWRFDWAGWADLALVSVAAGTFDPALAENAVLRHTRSIADWARDETNRDRLAAWSLAVSAWRAAPLWGQGLGATGAAALRTQPERAFVTESQVLKALVELGPLGLLALAYLWAQIGRTGLRAYRQAAGPTRRALLLGLLTSLLVVFIEGWVYQNLEVKQVNAYFWALAGIVAALAGPAAAAPEAASGRGDPLRLGHHR